MSYGIDDLHIRHRGDPSLTPVIFLHGFPVFSGMWDPLVDLLEHNIYAILVDLSGMGKSPARKNCPATIDHHADDIMAIIENEKLDKPILCGFSMGGYITLRFAEKYPDAFRALILCDTKSESDNDAGRIKRSDLIGMIEQKGLAEFFKAFSLPLFSKESYANQPERIEDLLSNSSKVEPRGISDALLAMAARTDTSAVLGKLSVPVQFLVGSDDTLTTPDTMSKMNEICKNSNLKIIEGAGHMAPFENPEAVADIFRTFISTLTHD